MNLSQCKIIDLPKVTDRRGNLSFIEGNKQVPFEIKRVYYLYDVPGGESRGGHAHKSLQQFIIAASGSFDVILDDGFQRKSYQLNRPYYGLYVPPLIWRELNNFSSGSFCLVLVSDLFDENDYIRDYETFKEMVKKGELRNIIKN
ncbi:MAG: FdtA/QdtA family cupin domain-containing protein [Candidatus Bathyarchaeota archaeon]|nr:FdtA/QdtA family cupin domain-containing protein [Candidatus Bathyarchaeota archaeon]